MKHNKINHCVNTYPSPNKATNNLDSKRNSILDENTQVLRSNKDLKNLNYYISSTLMELVLDSGGNLPAKVVDFKENIDADTEITRVQQRASQIGNQLIDFR